MATEIESLLEYVLNIGGNELIVSEGSPSAVRLAGKVCGIPDAPVINPGALHEFLGAIEGESGTIVGGPWANVKWRVRYFREAYGNSAVFRPLLSECPQFADLGAPQSLENMFGFNSGLVVFAGSACSGKTTSATAYVSALCESGILRVSLLDEAREYPVKIGNSLIFENSVGTVASKIDQALCSGCDLFWMGDFDSANLMPMLRAANAGALVVCTITAGNTVGAIDALLAGVPSESRSLARTMLASVLKAVVVQRLLPSEVEGSPAVSIWEVLFNSQNAATFIRNGEYFKLPSVIAASAADGMLLMDDCLAERIRSGFITREEAERYVSNAARLG